MSRPPRKGTTKREAVMNVQRNSETVEARAKIGSTGRNANSNFLHRCAVAFGQPRARCSHDPAGHFSNECPLVVPVRASVATPALAATHPLPEVDFEVCRWS